MGRLTKKMNDGYVAENLVEENGIFSGEAIERLAIFENMVEKILLEQEEYTKQIEALKDPTSSKVHWRIKELMGKKLTNRGILLALKNHGVEVEDEA